MIPIACSLPAQDYATRRQALARVLTNRLLDAERGPGTLALSYELSPERVSALADVVSAESECCSFLSFGLDVPSGAGRVTLRIGAPPEDGGMLDEFAELAGLRGADAAPVTPGTG